jgi:hypothetical protein
MLHPAEPLGTPATFRSVRRALACRRLESGRQFDRARATTTRTTNVSRGLVLADGEREIVSSPATLLGRVVTSDGEGEVASVVPAVSRPIAQADDSPDDTPTVEAALAVIDTGDLVKTDRRVAFLGEEHEVEVSFSDLLMWNLEGAVLRIYAEQQPSPFLFGLDGASDALHRWTDHVEDPTAVLDPGDDGSWIQPGFPRRILPAAEERAVDADPLLPFAAALLDTWPSGGLVDAHGLANALGISDARAAALLSQLEALGFAGQSDADGERAVFDPDGLTAPLGDLEVARGDDAGPAGSPHEASP